MARAQGFAPSELTVVTSGEEAGELVLTRLSTVRGKVVDAETGRPVSYFRAMIKKKREVGSHGQDMLYREFSHPRGEFLLEGLLPQHYSIAVIADGYGRNGFVVSVTEGSAMINVLTAAITFAPSADSWPH